VLVGAGYSMGAIILSNYVASYGRECALDAAVAVSGGLDMRYQEHAFRAQRLWQPMLAGTLRDKFLLGKFGHRLKEKLSPFQFLKMMRATHITVSCFFIFKLTFSPFKYMLLFSSHLISFHLSYCHLSLIYASRKLIETASFQ